MTTSDLERSLAEARAAAARRLQSLKRAGAQRQDEPAPPAPAIDVQREPSLPVGEAGKPLSQVPPEQVVRIDSPSSDYSPVPPAVHSRVDPVAAAPEPVVTHARPAHSGSYAPQRLSPEATFQPDPGTGYVPVDPISRMSAQVAGPPFDSVAPLEFAEAREELERGGAEIGGRPGFMARLVAGLTAFRRSRAERRALADIQAAPIQPRKQALTAKERRWERRRKRYVVEEILGWIFVPIILVAIYFFALWLLELFGTTPDALIEGVQTIWRQFR